MQKGNQHGDHKYDDLQNCHDMTSHETCHYGSLLTNYKLNLPVSQYERPRAVALASSACVDKTTKIITEFTRKDPFLRLKRVN